MHPYFNFSNVCSTGSLANISPLEHAFDFDTHVWKNIRIEKEEHQMSGFDFTISMICFAIVGLVIAYHVIKSAVRNGIKESGLINVKTTYEELRSSEPSYVELRKGIVESNPDKPDGEIDRLTRSEAESIINKKRASHSLLAFTVSVVLILVGFMFFMAGVDAQMDSGLLGVSIIMPYGL